MRIFTNALFISLIIFVLPVKSSAQLYEAARNGLDTSRGKYLLLTTGEIVEGEKLKYSKAYMYDGRETTISIDGKKYSTNQVAAFQDKGGYYKNLGKMWFMRIATGKIDLYYFGSYPNARYYILLKDQPIKEIRIADLKEAIKDNPEALQLLNKTYPKDRYLRQLKLTTLVEVVNLYNRNQ
jgi:hypothetical protein